MSKNRLGFGAAMPAAAAGWTISALVQPPKMIGANGLRRGADGLLYCAQAFGSQITAIDPSDGSTHVVVAADGAMGSPDDLAFDSHGNLFATQFMNSEVSVRRPNGRVETFAGGFTFPNGITIHHDRIFVSEFNPAGRIMEVFADGRAPRVIADGQIFPNALDLSPDGHLYYSHVVTGEVWRVAVEGGEPQRIAEGLSLPTAIKVAADGAVWAINAATGAVETINVTTGRRSLFSKLPPGIDNFEFAPGGGVYVSHFTDGRVTHIAQDGTHRLIVDPGMVGPGGLAAAPDGSLIVADGVSYASVGTDGSIERPITVVEHGAPAYMRCVAVDRSGVNYFTSPGGMLASYRAGHQAETIADDLDQPYGVAVAPSGELLICEAGSGSLLAFGPQGRRTVTAGLSQPTGVTVDADGRIFVVETGLGRVIEVESDGNIAELAGGYLQPQGIAASNGSLIVYDRGVGVLHRIPVANGQAEAIASGFAIDADLAGTRATLPGLEGLPMLQGPLSPFAGVAVLADGRICVGSDSDGAIWAVEPASSSKEEVRHER
jgi:sugar lactone lactonase YvrE